MTTSSKAGEQPDKICYPRKPKPHFEGEIIRATQFFATGFGKGAKKVVGTLINDKTGSATRGIWKRGNPKWILFFDVKEPDATATYTLEVWYYDRGTKTKLDEVPKIRFRLVFGATISFPVNNGDNWCSEYPTAQGETSSPDTVVNTASLNNGGGDGTVINETGSWFADWPALAPNTYDLTVTPDESPPVTRTGLVAAPEHC